MSAYSRVYQGLVAGGMKPADAAADLAALRSEIGTELAVGLTSYAAEQYGPSPADSHGAARTKKRKHGAVSRAAAWVISATTTGRLTTTPHPRTNRSQP